MKYFTYVSVVMRRVRLRWFEHVERMRKVSVARRMRKAVVKGRVGSGRPEKAYDEVVENDLKGNRSFTVHVAY